MTRTCNREGCLRPVQARGLCNSHYKAWWRTTTVKPSKVDVRQIILDAMPGTYRQLERETGFCYDTVLLKVQALREEGLAHVGDIEPPVRGMSGAKFMLVFWAGPGKDKSVTRAMRIKHRNKAGREARALRLMVQRGDPLVHAMYGRSA